MVLVTLLAMGLSLSSSRRTSQRALHSTPNMPQTRDQLESRLRAALWSFFAGDALAAPTHWYYGGASEIRRDYGSIQGYTKPVYHLPGSILNKSNLNGGGRSHGRSSSDHQTIIGDVICHGKKDLWSPTQQIHYHATLAKGENTLEAQLARVLMKSIVANDGTFDAHHFRQAYIAFMTTPGSHNDTYASTCHRMFFENLVHRGLPPEDCADNDYHNTDAVDGLVLPTIVALAAKNSEQAAKDAQACSGVTRASVKLDQASAEWGRLVYGAVRAEPSSLPDLLQNLASTLGLRRPSVRRQDELTACYLASALPALLDSILSHREESVWEGLLANANTGGENVHRGSCLGAVLGSQHAFEELESELSTGLHDSEQLKSEIDDFIKVVLRDDETPVVG